jgi:hypothetical protein
MSTILARCTAIGIVAGGFALTGDLGRLADRGMKVLNASDVPAARGIEPGSAVAEPTSGLVAAPAPAPAAPSPPAAAHDPTPVAKTLDFRPATGGLERADIAGLDPGNRLVVWFTVARRVGQPAYRCLVFDMVDPAAAEALVYEAVSFTADGHPQATATPPRRVRISGGADDHTVAKGSFLRIQHLGIAQDLGGEHGGGGEVAGPIASLDVIR